MKITINGNTIEVGGDQVNIVSHNGTMSFNGGQVVRNLSGTVHLKIEGGVASIEADGSVTCKDVAGDVRAGGSVTAGNVTGDVKAGGSVTAEKVTGKISAAGSVNIG